MTVLVSTHYMDEAERCDRIVYLANGKVIVRGAVADVLEESSLVTFRAEGEGVRRLAGALKGKPGVDHVAYFGSALHVSGTDRTLLEKSVNETSLHGAEWREVRTSLEDAFIALMARAGEDARVHA